MGPEEDSGAWRSKTEEGSCGALVMLIGMNERVVSHHRGLMGHCLGGLFVG